MIRTSLCWHAHTCQDHDLLHQSWGSMDEAYSMIMMSLRYEVEVWACVDGSASFQQSATFAKNSCIRQLAIIRPALTSSDLEIVNSIVWKLSLSLSKAVPKSDTLERAYKTYRSRSTIRWVAGDHSTTVDHFETAAITKRNPQGITEVTCFQGCLMLTLAGIST